jgi:hypothetical protein
MPGRLRVVVSVGKAGCGNNSGNSGDDPRAGAPQNDETPSSHSPWPSSKENEETTDQAMTINAARSLRWSARRGSGGKHRWKASVPLQWQKHCNLTACLCLGRQEDAWSLACKIAVSARECAGRGVETAVMIRGRARRKTMKRPRLNPLALIQGKR